MKKYRVKQGTGVDEHLPRPRVKTLETSGCRKSRNREINLESVHGESARSRKTRTDRHADPSVVQPGTSPAAGDCYGGVVGWFTELGQAPVMLLVSGNLGKLGRSSLGGTGRTEYLFHGLSREYLCLVDCSVQVDMEQSSPVRLGPVFLSIRFHVQRSSPCSPKPAPWHDDVWCGAASLYQAPGPSLPANYPAPYTIGAIRTGTVSVYAKPRNYTSNCSHTNTAFKPKLQHTLSRSPASPARYSCFSWTKAMLNVL